LPASAWWFAELIRNLMDGVENVREVEAEVGFSDESRDSMLEEADRLGIPTAGRSDPEIVNWTTG